MCFHNTNLCDLHPVCDDAEDEDETICAEKYKEKNLLRKEATYRCQSPYHNQDSVKNKFSKGVVWIRAVPQDGIPECWNSEDEVQTPPYLTYGLPGDVQVLLSQSSSMCDKRVCSFQLDSLLPLCLSQLLQRLY